MAAGQRGEGGGTKPADDVIQGLEYYAEQIQAIEAADVCFGLQPEFFSNELCVFAQNCLCMYFL